MTFPAAPIGALAEVVLGKMVQGRQRLAEDVQLPYLRAAHVQPNGILDLTVQPHQMWFSPREAQALDLRRGDVVVVEGGVGGYGRAAWVSHDLDGWGFQNSIVRLRPRPGAEGRYLAHALVAARNNGEIAAECFGAGMPHFPAEKVARFRVPHPHPYAQRRIADYLDRETAEIDAMDAELDRLLETLRERRMHSILSRVQLGHSDLEGSRVASIQMVATLISGAGFPTDEQGREDQELPFYKVNALGRADADGVIRFQDHTISTVTAKRLRADVVPAGASVLAKIGAALMLGRIRTLGRPGCVDNNMLALVPGPEIEERYLFWALHALDMNQIVNPSTIPFLNERALRQFQIPLPSRSEQRHIVTELDDQTARIDDMVADANRLKALLAERRSTLITEVVTGIKEVPA